MPKRLQVLLGGSTTELLEGVLENRAPNYYREFRRAARPSYYREI